MLIVCPSCATSYEVGPAALGATGRSVRCAHCKSTWFATPREELPVIEAAADDAGAPQLAPVDNFSHAEASAAPIEPASEDIHTPADDIRFVEPDESSITTIEAPPLSPEHIPPGSQISDIDVAAQTPTEPVEAVAARRQRRRQTERKDRPSLVRRLTSAPMAIFVLLVTLACVVQMRDKIVRHAPQTASLFAAIGMPVNLRGLVFEDVVSRTEIADGVPVLIIEGKIINITTRTIEVPRLRLALRNSAHHEVYAWTAQPPKPTVGSGNALVFRTRLASPPQDGHDVVVRFFTRRDVTAGLQ